MRTPDALLTATAIFRYNAHMKRIVLLCAAACALPLFAKPAASVPRRFTVLTWNTQHYGWWDLPKPKQELLERNMFEVVRAANPDIFLQQETYGSFERFCQALPGYKGVLQSGCNSLFTKFPVVSTNEHWYDRRFTKPLPMWAPNLALAELDAGGCHLRVGSYVMFYLPLCVRLPKKATAFELLELEACEQTGSATVAMTPRPQAIRQGLAAIQPILADRDLVPVILGGDFNSLSDLDWTEANAQAEGHLGRVVPWPVHREMRKAGFVDAWRTLYPNEVKDPGNTFPVPDVAPDIPRPFIRLDYVYSAGTRVKPVAAEVISGAYHKPFEWKGKKFSAFPSDHAALLVTYEIVQATNF